MATKPLIGLAALLGLAGAGFAAWAYYGHGGHACCRVDDAGRESPQSAAPVPADDATLIASQRYCPVMTDTKLGEMGAPVKLTVTGKDGREESVFVCCKGCKRKALADPDATLARVAEFRAATR